MYWRDWSADHSPRSLLFHGMWTNPVPSLSECLREDHPSSKHSLELIKQILSREYITFAFWLVARSARWKTYTATYEQFAARRQVLKQSVNYSRRFLKRKRRESLLIACRADCENNKIAGKKISFGEMNEDDEIAIKCRFAARRVL